MGNDIFKQILKKESDYIHLESKNASLTERVYAKKGIMGGANNAIINRLNLVSTSKGSSIASILNQPNEWDELVKALDDLTNKINENKPNDVNMSNIVNSKAYLAQKMKSNNIKQVSDKMKELLENLEKMFAIVNKADPVKLRIAVGKILESNPQQYNSPWAQTVLKIIKNSQTDKPSVYIGSRILAQAEQFIQEFIQNDKLSQITVKTLKGQLTNNIHKNYIESYVGYQLANAIGVIDGQIDKTFSFTQTGQKSAIKNTGLQGSKQQQYDKISSKIRSDVQVKGAKMGIEIDINDNKIDINLLGTNVKYYKSTKGGGIAETYFAGVNKDTGKANIDLVKIALLNKSRLLTYINEISGQQGQNSQDTRRYILNAYVHQNKEVIDAVENNILVSAFMGTGQRIKGGGLDVNLLFYINGKFYSILSLLDSIIKTQNKDSILFEYSDELNKARSANSKIGKRNNWNKAYERSHKVLQDLKKVLVSAYIYPKYFNQLATNMRI